MSSMTSSGISPLPAEARPYQGHRAGLVTRLVAATIDSLLVGLVLLLGYVGFTAFTFLIDPRTFSFPEPGLFFSLAAVRADLGAQSRSGTTCSIFRSFPGSQSALNSGPNPSARLQQTRDPRRGLVNRTRQTSRRVQAAFRFEDFTTASMNAMPRTPSSIRG